VTALKDFIIDFDFDYPTTAPLPQYIKKAEYFIQTGFTSFPPFRVTSSAGVSPVRLLSFAAANKKDDVLLQWKTEMN